MKSLETEKKIHKKTVRLTDAELEKVEGLCKIQELNFSEYIRLLIARDMGKIIARKTKSAYQQDKKLIEQIRRIGVNINQIAENINGYFYSVEDKERLFCLMESIRELLKKKVSQKD